MEEARRPDLLAEITPLLWLLALALVALGAQAGLGYVRASGRAAVARLRWAMLGAGGTALGSAVWGAMLLGVSAQLVDYPMGYRALGLAIAWAWAVAGSALAVLLLARWEKPVGLGVAALVFGATALGVQWLLVHSLGLLPGTSGHVEALALALPLAVSGAGGGFWVALHGHGRSGARRRAWRWAAAGMAAAGVLASQVLVVEAAGFGARQESAYQHQVPTAAGALLGLCGVPMLLLAAQFDLQLRRDPSERREDPRRKRRRQRRQLL